MGDIDNRGVYARPDVAARFDAERRIGEADDFVNRWEVDYFLRQALALMRPTPDAGSGPAAPGSVIDMGAGTGKLALAFAAAGWRVTALDQSPAMLERLSDKAGAMGLTVRCRLGDAVTTAPERDFDVAVSSRVLMHVPDPAGMLGVMAGFARRGVIFDAPRRLSPNRLLVLARRLTGGEVYRCFDDGFLRTELVRYGLTVVDLSRMFTAPISLHLALANRALSQRLEAALVPARVLASTAFVTGRFDRLDETRP